VFPSRTMNRCEKISSAVRQQTLALFAFVILTTSQQALGQFHDDFSDGDIVGSPPWSGSDAHFTVNALQQLQLNNTIAGSSFLTTAFAANLGETEWQFYLRQNFAGSSSNYGRIYLVSDQQDLRNDLNGYYLQFGESGSLDAIELFRQTGTTSHSVCKARSGGIAAAFAIRVKVTRNNAGMWTIHVDYSGGSSFVEEATGSDLVHTSSLFFGIACTYTSANSKNFFYDNFSIQNIPAPDVTPPQLTGVKVLSATELEVNFSEVVTSGSAGDITHYLVTPNNMVPVSAALMADLKMVRLSFASAFVNGFTSLLNVSGVQDQKGNMLDHASMSFVYFRPTPPSWKDVIITELFPDPSPAVALPEAEFIEIFNRSANPFDLAGWTLTDGASTGALSSYLLLPGEHVVVTSSSARPMYATLGSTISLSTFPSLNNAGDFIVLKDPANKSIDSVKYSLSWYRDSEKQDGGWTLELIDPENVCSEFENWTASENPMGGTPGKMNSVFADKPDLKGPHLVSAIPITEFTLSLVFDEKLDKGLPNPANFVVTPDLPISSVHFSDGSLTTLNLILQRPLAPGVKYEVVINNVYDCAGNVSAPEFSRIAFALPEAANSLDVVINEVLFNPRSTGVDFVECFNRSQKYINLRGWTIANGSGSEKVVSTSDHLIDPASFFVLTEDGNVLKGEYLQSNEKSFIATDMPAFGDDEGVILLLDDQRQPVDSFAYSEKMHSRLLKEEEGVSLERISVEMPSNESANWKSASSTSGFATPGLINSNTLGDVVTDGSIVVEPEIFVPVFGQPDFTQIRYSLEQGGYVANVKIFDSQGREIRQLANNEILGTEGFFRWDGDMQNGTRARIGAYMVWVEIFDEKGSVRTFKKRVVVAGRF
jgi:hypothetical protein